MANRDVKLNISKSSKSGDGWLSATANNGVNYWYKFTGGNSGKNNGDDEFDTDDNSRSFDVEFKQSDKDDYNFINFYKIASSDPHNQLSAMVEDDQKLVTVTDLCTQPTQGMTYGVTVEDVSTSAQFNCHPVISNKPRDK